MANFAYSANHLPAVNLDRVDLILRSETKEKFHIIFHGYVDVIKMNMKPVIGYWSYETEEERDAVFNKLMEEHGSAY